LVFLPETCQAAKVIEYLTHEVPADFALNRATPFEQNSKNNSGET
jgi:hypothetical protein